MSFGADWACSCGWANLDVRKRCRNCGKDNPENPSLAKPASEPAEPMAWMIQYENGCRNFYLCEQLALSPGHKQTPLFAHPAPATVESAELVRAASALLNNLWQDVWSYDRTHEENWKEFDRKFPGVKWLRDARDAALASATDAEGRA